MKTKELRITRPEVAVGKAVEKHVDSGVGVCEEQEEDIDGVGQVTGKVKRSEKGKRRPADGVGKEEEKEGPCQLHRLLVVP